MKPETRILEKNLEKWKIFKEYSIRINKIETQINNCFGTETDEEGNKKGHVGPT